MIQEIAQQGYYEGVRSKRTIEKCDVQIMFQRTRDLAKGMNITILTAKARPVQESEVRQEFPRIIDYIGMI